MTRHSHYLMGGILRRVVAAGWLVLFVAVWGGLPAADAAQGHAGAVHAHLGVTDASVVDLVAGEEVSCALCDLIGTAAVVGTPGVVLPAAAWGTATGFAPVTDAARSRAHRADAPRAPPIM